MSTTDPATFGMVFARGDVPDTVALMKDGQRQPAQVDRLASWPDGSLKLGRITVLSPGDFDLVTTTSSEPDQPAQMPDVDFEARVTIDGTDWTAQLPSPTTSTGGSLFVEYDLPTIPLTDADGSEHPYLALKAWVWHYPTTGQTEVVATIDNTWAKTADDQVPTDTIAYKLSGNEVFSEDDVTIAKWTRTRVKRFWTGDEPISRHVDRDLGYLRSTGAVPNYDPSLEVPGDALSSQRESYASKPHGLMGRTGEFYENMGTGGGRASIGPLPRWAVMPLVTNDPDALDLSMDIDDASGVWPINLRDRDTDHPLSVADYPNATTLGAADNDDNPVALQCLGDDCLSGDGTPLTANPPHEPMFNYVSYLLTTDPFYLEEMNFWETYNIVWMNPNYRHYDEDIFIPHMSVRGAAWMLRNLQYLAFILPDDHPRKPLLEGYLTNNLDYLTSHYVTKPESRLGFLGTSTPYRDWTGIAPWQDDFMTWSMANAVRLGYEDWRAAAEWKAGFVVARMTEACYQFAAIYSVEIRNERGGPFYTDWPTILAASASQDDLDTRCGTIQFEDTYEPGDFSGYPASPDGFPANMQPALAVSVDLGLQDAADAWATYETRPTKQSYGAYPVWAIVPSTP